LKNNNQVVKRPLGRPKNFTLPIPTPKPEDKPKGQKEEDKKSDFPVSLGFEAQIGQLDLISPSFTHYRSNTESFGNTEKPPE
jgi:hypothetical protein